MVVLGGWVFRMSKGTLFPDLERCTSSLSSIPREWKVHRPYGRQWREDIVGFLRTRKWMGVHELKKSLCIPRGFHEQPISKLLFYHAVERW